MTPNKKAFLFQKAARLQFFAFKQFYSDMADRHLLFNRLLFGSRRLF